MNKGRQRSVNGRKKHIIAGIIVIAVVIVTFTMVIKHLHNQNDIDIDNLSYDGEISVEVNDNEPGFTEAEKKRAHREVFEEYSKLDKLGRCGTAFANICIGTMPSEYDERTNLGSIYPSGWQAINFWSRCHLIAYQLSAENDNEKNLITGTSRMNLSGMRPYENKVAEYINDNPENHVLYKVEPIYLNNNLVASGVHMQAWSVEDNGKGLSYNVFVFNYQPGYIIDYSDGSIEDDPEHQTFITLKDKKARYTGEPINIDDAIVEGSTGAVRYIYFTDSGTKNKTTIFDGADKDGGAPSEKGTYYVVATVGGDNWYPSAASKAARLDIR